MKAPALSILVVEDERGIGFVVSRVLTAAGYAVQVVSSAEEALPLLAASRAGFALLLTDLTLPGMSGRELARRARMGQPSLRTLFVSGDALPGDTLDECPMLAKPFTGQGLQKAVAKALAASP